jgi:hypothetical protein
MSEVAQISELLLSQSKSYALILRKNGFGYILGNFFSQTHLATMSVSCLRDRGRKGRFLLKQKVEAKLGMYTNDNFSMLWGSFKVTR